MKFLRDKAHCKHQSYTKEDIDTMLDKKIDATEVYTKGNYAVLEYTIPAETLEQDPNEVNSWYNSFSNVDDCSVKLPDGFTPDNTIIVSSMWKEGDGAGNGLDGYWSTRLKSFLSSNDRNIYYEGIESASINQYDINGENRLWFSFHLWNNATNPKPIYLKFLIMKVE